ncbi:MAG: putative toxin-antitoxin system toxin component, PIN family [Anaerolineae bacterium]|nr:putative toxin-antitoxin system toxin component, PIN family [Anaerolineae bacterium]MCI0610117.1 putative toxin-antitoxin system toxin component, PIN family [Anaerolineae bacterium]
MKRVVLDTNIFVSMALGGQVGKINDEWRAGKFILVVSNEIVSEYLDVLQRPKLHLKSRTIATIVNRIYRKAEFVAPEEKIFVVLADTSDNKFIEAAIEGKTDYIVSGDKHLLDLKEFQSIPIITAREFLDILETA